MRFKNLLREKEKHINLEQEGERRALIDLLKISKKPINTPIDNPSQSVGRQFPSSG